MKLSFDWRFLAFLNYRLEGGAFDRYLPEGLEVDDDGRGPLFSFVASVVHKTQRWGIHFSKKPFVQFHGQCYVRNRHRRGVLWLDLGARPKIWKFFNQRTFGARWKQLETRQSIEFNPGEQGASAKVAYSGENDQGKVSLKMETGGPIYSMDLEPVEAFIWEREFFFTPHRKEPLHLERPLWFCWQALNAQLTFDGDPFMGSELSRWTKAEPESAFLVKGSSVLLHD